MQPEYSVFTYLIHMILSAYMYVVMLRLMMQYVGVNYFNPLVHVCLTLTDWAVKPLRKIMPGIKGIDFAIVLFWFVIAAINLIILTWLDLDAGFPNILGLIIWVVGAFLDRFLDIYLIVIIIRAIMSWFPQLANNPVGEAVYMLTEPVQSRVSKLVPPVGMIDFSPLLVLLAVYLIDRKSVV